MAGILLGLGSPWAWIGVAPAVWFVGMALSHGVYGRCVLNELAIRLQTVHRKRTPIRARQYSNLRQYTHWSHRNHKPANPKDNGILTLVRD